MLASKPAAVRHLPPTILHIAGSICVCVGPWWLLVMPAERPGWCSQLGRSFVYPPAVLLDSPRPPLACFLTTSNAMTAEQVQCSLALGWLCVLGPALWAPTLTMQQDMVGLVVWLCCSTAAQGQSADWLPAESTWGSVTAA